MGKLAITYEDLKVILINSFNPKGKHWVALFDKIDSLGGGGGSTPTSTAGIVAIPLSDFYLDGGNYVAVHGIPAGASILGSYFSETECKPVDSTFILAPSNQEATAAIAAAASTAFEFNNTLVNIGVMDVTSYGDGSGTGYLVIDYIL